ncbi:MAG: hypothetical protein JOY54_15205 [Acidobacteriaceae bacterium]|nr:hypothetical protein [Acidobacteriaceae bacterium]
MNTNALNPDCPDPGKFVHLSRIIPAFELVPEVDGQSKLGIISRLPDGVLLEVCGEGFNSRTVKVRMGGKHYFVFRVDLPRAECDYCKAEITSYVNGKLICLQCESAREHLEVLLARVDLF